MKSIVKDPQMFYDKYKAFQSPHTSIPDFKDLVDKIHEKLNDGILFTFEFENEKKLLLQEFYFLKDLYYDDVIRFCSKFVDLIDIMLRKTPEHTYPDYFHRKRYFYYMEYCISKFPNIILFPTFDSIGATDLIKTRCVPCFLVGISLLPVYADEFVLTPSEFFFHDINHSRIIYQQDDAYIKNKEISKEQLILEMVETTQHYYNTIKTIEDKKMVALMKMIIFEIIHEDGFSFLYETICKRLVRPEGEDFVERMEGGVIELVKKITPSTIGITLFKLRCGFFDKENEPFDVIVDTKYRTVEKIILATQQLLTIFKCNPEPYDKLHDLVINNTIVPYRKCFNDLIFAGKKTKQIRDVKKIKTNKRRKKNKN